MFKTALSAFLAGAALLTARGSAGAAGTAFAIVPPAVVASLSSKASTSAGEKAIRAADKGLAKPPTPMEHIAIAGLLPGQGLHDQSHEAVKDLSLMRELALAYRLTGDRRYLGAVTTYLQAWISTYHTQYQPIDDTSFYPVFFAYDLTRADLPADLVARTDAWMRDFSSGYLGEIRASRKINNWQSHRVALATLAAFSTGDDNLIAQAHAAFEQQISANLRADGSVYDFYDRDAIHYVTYDLDPLLMAADAARLHGQDWFHYTGSSGGSLPASLAWLAPYATGQKTHVEFANSKVKFDIQRENAGLTGFSGNWDASGSLQTYAFATALDPANRSVLEQNVAYSHAKIPDWVELLVLDAGSPAAATANGGRGR